MAAIYLVSTRAQAGKTAVGAALGRWLRSQGHRVGYLKPVSSGDHGRGDSPDGDAVFMKRVLVLPEPSEELVGVTLSPNRLEEALKGQTADFPSVVRKAYDWVARNRDSVILEAPHDLEDGAAIGLPAAAVANLLEARALLVFRYRNEAAVDEILAAATTLGPRLVGVLINAVSSGRLDHARETLVPFLEGRGVRVLGLLPQERDLMGVSVGELADALKGEVITAARRRDDLVQNVMVGTMAIESAYDYFRRKSDKAVIVTVDRPDLQIAALQTSIRCLIVAGHLPPNPVVVARAEEMNVPLIVVRRTTLDTVETVEAVFGQARFRQEGKLDTMLSLLQKHVNLAALESEVKPGRV